VQNHLFFKPKLQRGRRRSSAIKGLGLAVVAAFLSGRLSELSMKMEARWNNFHVPAGGSRTAPSDLFTDENPATTTKGTGFKACPCRWVGKTPRGGFLVRILVLVGAAPSARGRTGPFFRLPGRGGHLGGPATKWGGRWRPAGHAAVPPAVRRWPLPLAGRRGPFFPSGGPSTTEKSAHPKTYEIR
jgi:hypothetical protein